jgi:hypothetical protein
MRVNLKINDKGCFRTKRKKLICLHINIKHKKGIEKSKNYRIVPTDVISDEPLTNFNASKKS